MKLTRYYFTPLLSTCGGNRLGKNALDGVFAIFRIATPQSCYIYKLERSHATSMNAFRFWRPGNIVRRLAPSKTFQKKRSALIWGLCAGSLKQRNTVFQYYMHFLGNCMSECFFCKVCIAAPMKVGRLACQVELSLDTPGVSKSLFNPFEHIVMNI